MANSKFVVTTVTQNNTTWTPVVGVLLHGLVMRCTIHNPDSSDDLLVATDTAGSAASVSGTEVEPYNITLGSNDTLKIDVDQAASPQTVTITAGTNLSAATIAGEINAQTTGLTATVVHNRIVITSNTVGATSEIDIQAVANDAYTALGFSVSTTNGLDSTAYTIQQSGAELVIEMTRSGFSYNEIICYLKGAGDPAVILQMG